MVTNESIISLNLSTVEGVNRNRMSKKCMQSFNRMLIQNKFMTTLILYGVNLGNNGMTALCRALLTGLDESIEV